ncbi:FecCD family ABC transporter permease [Streptomyces albipurpureus]|uniref:Iron chelate uptake ABC transporter family permease subunit n=1 Tax=Streptomyces albipurpureus TaxID=2897419 RepID=A0ABT0UNQ5_9ACTN|nr:iron chelate uptake ABC transporter family permease subunit [Streptomyces sp. CWNU-1]MCM2389619.1 iron chelate uptake ABC transporter family permease subunit [Streptomyces sp. CWNU-1]
MNADIARNPSGEASTASERDPNRVDFGYEVRGLRCRWFSVRMGVRLATVSAVLFLAALTLAVMSIRFGEYALTIGDVIAALTGSGAEFHRVIVVEWRLPVVVAAIVFGALLGIGGAVFQSLTRNPLGSPDVIGFDAGSYTAVVLCILVFGRGGYWSVAGAAIVGGLATALLVYVLAYRRGVQGFRLIIVGIGVSAMLGSINAYLIARADLTDAMTVGFWGAGSITRVAWSGMFPSLVIAVVIVLAAVLLAPYLRRLELGDDAAITLGTRVQPARLALLVVGVATTALVTAAAGPIGFVALVAPQLARRLTRSPGVSMLSAAAMGAALLAAAHFLAMLIAQFYRPIPVGLITVCLGGLYLIRLLIRESRRQYGVSP